MNQAERRVYLIKELLAEEPKYRKMPVPQSASEQRDLLRALMNVRPPRRAGEELLRVQDEYLKEEIAAKGVTDIDSLTPVREGIYLWRGDITTLACDAIVNAANSQLLGCFAPLHGCIDNAIHTYAGIELRLRCAELMEAQGREEPTGRAKITPAYNLPCKFILHTVGPIVEGRLTREHRELLASCYRECLALARENGLESVAFCCISTGVFGFPKRQAAEIAIKTVEQHRGNIRAVFNVFTDEDREIYENLLRQMS